jgi:hypothetical protein
MRTLIFLILLSTRLTAQEIITNSIQFTNPPEWLGEDLLGTATGKVQDFLEWDLHRVKAYWHADQAEFEKAHGGGPWVKAFFKHSDQSLHVGPKVDAANFKRIFAHEMVHAVFFQKYKKAIPPWLEEGLANYVGETSKADYAWLSKQNLPDVTKLAHPLKEQTDSKLHYQVSTALVEMIASHCSLHDLLHLSVGRSLEKYLSTYCEISDVNKNFRDWIKEKSKKLLGKAHSK